MQREDRIYLNFLLLLSILDENTSGKPLPDASFSERGVQDKSYTLFKIYRTLNTELGLLFVFLGP